MAGLIVTCKVADDDSDSTSGGFSSGDDCVSSEEGESDLSSVSERETDDSENNDENDNKYEDVSDDVQDNVDTVILSP